MHLRHLRHVHRIPSIAPLLIVHSWEAAEEKTGLLNLWPGVRVSQPQHGVGFILDVLTLVGRSLTAMGTHWARAARQPGRLVRPAGKGMGLAFFVFLFPHHLS
jgi:hypothetical protein